MIGNRADTSHYLLLLKSSMPQGKLVVWAPLYLQMTNLIVSPRLSCCVLNIKGIVSNGPTPASFLFNFGLLKQTLLQFLQQINVKKMSCPSSIHCRDLNPWPSEHEPSPITTRPGLPLTKKRYCWQPQQGDVQTCFNGSYLPNLFCFTENSEELFQKNLKFRQLNRWALVLEAIIMSALQWDQKKLPNIYKSCLKMITLEKW